MAHLEVKPKSRSNWWLWLILVIIIIAVGYYFWSIYSGSGRTIVNTNDSTKTTASSTTARTPK